MLKHRLSSSSSSSSSPTSPSLLPLKQSLPLPLPPLFTPAEEIPAWIQKDVYILTGYRRPQASFKACFDSLWYLHNETVNIWSHLGTGVAMGWLLWWSFWGGGGGELEGFGERDLGIVRYYLISGMGCLFFSATYHCAFCHSECVGRFCLKLDYLGIVLSITSTGISAVYFALHSVLDQWMLAKAYIGMIAFFGLCAFWVVLDPTFQGPKAAFWRSTIFGLLNLSCYIPIIHAFLAEEVDTSEYPVWYFMGETAMHAVGAVFYVTRTPERQFPGRFDIWGSSHQIFHVIINASQALHLWAMQALLLQHRVLS